MRSGSTSQLTINKTERIRSDLEGRFELGIYKFGQKLNVNDLAKEFGVSRQPVMVALTELRNDGFVVITPQVGCAAARPTPSEITDFFSVFARMDGRMAALAAKRRVSEEIDALSAVLKELERSSGRVKQWSLAGLGGLVSQYHSIIRDMAKTPALASRVDRFWRFSNYIIRNARENYTEQLHKIANKERRAILDAIKSGDPELANLMMERHIIGKPQRVGLVPSVAHSEGPVARKPSPLMGRTRTRSA